MTAGNNKKEVLIVEDEHVIAMVCHRILLKQGYNVTLAPDGNTALRLIEKNKFDIFLIDIKIPGVDGLGVHRFILQAYPPHSYKAIFMTGDTLSMNLHNFEANTGCRLLKKPFSIDELLDAINSAHN